MLHARARNYHTLAIDAPLTIDANVEHA